MYKNLQSFIFLFFVYVGSICCGYCKSYSQTPNAGGIVYVKKGSTGGNGSSWASPVGELADALKAAKTNTAIKQIWVSKGKYYPLYSPEDGANFGTDKGRDNAFLLVKDVKIYGGFDPDNGITSLGNKRISPSAVTGSVLSGDFSNNDIAGGGGSTLTIINNEENAYHVVISAGEVGGALLDGFTISGGNANKDSGPLTVNSIATYRSNGGGIFNVESSPTFSNVVVSKNATASTGGGIANYTAASPKFINALIFKNFSNVNGGGIFNNMGSSPVLTNTIIAMNKANSGGALYNYDIPGTMSIPKLYNSVIYGNSSLISGYNPTFGPIYSAQYSLIQGDSNTSNGNINGNTNPQFTDMENDDYTLAAGSPLIDMGSNLYAASDKDISGNPRIRNNRADIGAYETQTGNTVPYVRPGTNNIVYVKKGTNGTGGSWNNALGELADALQWAQASNGENIWNAANPLKIYVSKGEYRPSVHPSSNSTATGRNITFLLVRNVQIYGGFDPDNGIEDLDDGRILPVSGTEGTVLKGTTPGGQKVYHVVLSVDNVGKALLDGLTITGGNANGGGSITVNGTLISQSYGAGTYNVSSSPTLTNVAISENSTTGYGGGVYNDYSSPALTNVTISGNNANSGGGMDNFHSSPVLTNVTIRDNTSSFYGAGMFNDTSSPVLTNVTISGNIVGDGNGGGIHNSNSSSPTLTNVAISGNRAINGGGIYIENSSPTLTNVVITGNKVDTDGGGIYNVDSSLALTNVTISGNKANNGGGIYNAGSSPVLKNSIVWGNGTNIYGNISTSSSHNLIEGGGTGNIDNMPSYLGVEGIFVSPQTISAAPTTAGDYRLKEASPAINVGDNSLYAGLNASTKDLVGNDRVYNYGDGGTIDIGAYESSYSLTPILSGFTDNITKNYGDASFSLTAPTSNSNGAFTYSTNDESIAAIVGNTVTIVGAGTVNITATQAATANFYEAQAVITLTVNKANIMLSDFSDINKTYGDSDFALTAPTSNSDGVFTYTSSNENVATVSGSTVTIVGAGTATITATQEATDNYNSGNISLTLTVGKGNPVLSGFANISKTYGDSDFALTEPTSDSDGEFIYSSNNENVATIVGNTVSIVGAGTATITATQASTDNYKDGTISLTLSVGKADQTITFAPLDSKTVSSPDFALTASSNSGLDITYSSGNTSVAEVYQDGGVWKVKIKGAGTTDIIASQIGDANYNSASNVSRGLVVIEAVLPVELVSYTAKREGGFVRLDWQTANEVNSLRFTVYRKGEGSKFTEIGEVSSNGSGQITPNASRQMPYTFTDKQPLNGNNYYKLVQVDHNGKETELGVRSLFFSLSAFSLNLFPNPSSNQVNVTFTSGRYIKLEVVDLNGRILQQMALSPAQSSQSILLGTYPAATYFIRLTGKGYAEIGKVVKW